MKYKFIFFILIILFTTSCSKYEELNNLSIISNIEIKYQDNNFVLTMQEINPKRNNESISYNYSYRTVVNKSLDKAFSNIINHSPKKIYLLKVQNIVINYKDHNKVFNELIKYQVNTNNINKKSSIIISKNSLEEIMNISNDYQYIDSILKDKKISLKDSVKKSKKIKIPLLNIKNSELEFKKYITFN